MGTLSENEIWRMVYLIGGDDYTESPDDEIYVLKDGKCIAEIDVKVTKVDDETAPKL